MTGSINALTIHVQPGVVEYSPPATPPSLYTAHGKDLTLDVGPTRTGLDIGYARPRPQVDVNPTRSGWTAINPTRQQWAVDNHTTTSAQADIDQTRLSSDIGTTRVQRNRS
jgi:hypothetical protein